MFFFIKIATPWRNKNINIKNKILILIFF